MTTMTKTTMDKDVSFKQAVAVARNYEYIYEAPDRFKMKQIDNMEKGDLHTLRMADAIVESDFQMGKETLWTVPEGITCLLDQLNEDVATEVADVSKEGQRMVLEQADTFSENLPATTDEVFLARDVDLRGRTPGGLHRHGFIEPDERRDGYATKWKMTPKGVAVVKLAQQIEDE